MGITLHPAVKVLKPMKVLSYGPTYSGKTLSSLYLAAGIVMSKRKCAEAEAYKHVVLIDTEFGRGALHNKIGPYNYIKIEPPYNTEKLVLIIEDLNKMPEVDVIVIDSLTHFWAKEGGILDQKAIKDKQGNSNSYTNWQEFTAKFNKMLDTILTSPKDILVTARAKTDTALVMMDTGKSVPKSFGLKPELRDGIEFEFDIVFNIDKITHNLLVDKGIPGLLPVYEIATPILGTELYSLFIADTVIPVRTPDDVITNIRNLAQSHNLIQTVMLSLNGKKLETLDMAELITLESGLLATIKKTQINK